MHHHHEQFWWRFSPKKDLDRIYVSVALRSFAVSLISLFVPLYLYKEMGFTLDQTLIFFIFYAVVIAISSPVAAKFASRYGMKHTVFFSVPFYLVYILLLYWLPIMNIPLILIGALAGIAVAFYWMGLHEVFYRVSDQKHRGEEVGKRAGISVFVTLFGPLVGGLLIKLVGFQFVFMLASLMLFLAALLLFLSHDTHEPYHFSLKNLVNNKNWKDSLFFVSRGASVMAAGVIWPLFIFVILNDYFTLGIVGSILAGVSGILIWLVGKISDKLGKRKILRWTLGFEALSWVLRSLVYSVGSVFAVATFASVTKGVTEAPMGALEYDKATQGDIAGYFVSREIYICLGRILLLVIVLMTDSLSGGMIFNGFASLAALLF